MEDTEEAIVEDSKVGIVEEVVAAVDSGRLHHTVVRTLGSDHNPATRADFCLSFSASQAQEAEVRNCRLHFAASSIADPFLPSQVSACQMAAATVAATTTLALLEVEAGADMAVDHQWVVEGLR